VSPCSSTGHDFQPRYSEFGASADELLKLAAQQGVDPQTLAEVASATRSRVYECDVCVRCGALVKQEGGQWSLQAGA
jgi:hypothetical protein